VTITATSDGVPQWQAVAVGDTCLFHVRDGVLARAFPLEHSTQFHNAPKLVGARMSLPQVAEGRSAWEDGLGRAGDRLWAMTDALAQWCLAECESGRDPWGELELLLAGPADGCLFEDWIDRLRQSRRLRNDDVTLVAVLL
jgi:hypothetical protein